MQLGLQRLQRFLAAHQVLTLAVVTPAGEPHAAAVFYAADAESALYFLSDVHSAHGQALRHDGRAAGAIQADAQHWRRIRGLQLRGRCRVLTGAERDAAWPVYVARFTFLRRTPPALARAMRATALWRLDLDWARLIDNRAGFARKWERTWP